VNGATRIAAATKLAIGAAFLSVAIARRSEKHVNCAGQKRAPENGTAVDRASLSPRLKLALWVFGVQGFVSVAFEVLWIRVLVLVMGRRMLMSHNTYVFSTILAVFLLGLTAGILWMTRRLRRVKDPMTVLARLQLAIGLYAVASLPTLEGFQVFTILGILVLGKNVAGFLLGNVAKAMALTFFPTFCMGAALPLVTGMYRDEKSGIGRKMAVIGFLDTAGCVLGAPAAAFAILPLCGIKGSVALVAAVCIVMGAMIAITYPSLPRRFARCATVAVPVVVFAVIAGLLHLARPLVLDPYDNANLRPTPPELPGAKDLESLVGKAFAPHVWSTCEGRESVVSVTEECGVKSVVVDHVSASDDSAVNRPGHTMIIHIPMLLAPQPRDVLLLGFGIGSTTLAARQYGAAVDVVELEKCELSVRKAVADAWPDFQSDPKVPIIIDDGRNYVQATNRKYDVIQAGIIHPGFSSGNASLYTLDFYNECKRILRPGGVFCQWLPLFGLQEADFKMLMRTFHAAFPHTSVWFKWDSDFVALVGTPDPLRIRWSDFVQRAELPKVRADLDQAHAGSVQSLLDSLFMSDDAVGKYTGEGPLHTDEHPFVDFSSARLITCNYYSTLLGMAPFREPVVPRIDGLGESGPALETALAPWFAATQEVILGQIAELKWQHENEHAAFRFDSANREAMRRYEQALAINPADENVKFHYSMLCGKIQMARAFSLLAKNDEEPALKALDGIGSISPGSPEAYLAQTIAASLRQRSF